MHQPPTHLELDPRRLLQMEAPAKPPCRAERRPLPPRPHASRPGASLQELTAHFEARPSTVSRRGRRA